MTTSTFPPRLSVDEACKILKISRATLYIRANKEKKITLTKDGSRTFIMGAELERYLAACAGVPASASTS